MMLSFVAIAAFLWIVAAAAALLVVFRRQVVQAWREPVLATPVLIIESDDWGYGPVEQAKRLRELAALLSRYRDEAGHPAVMTLGIVLAGPDTARIAAQRCRQYYRLTLADPALQPVRSEICSGREAGAFELQLHGMEHFWPPVLLSAARQDTLVHTWLTARELPATEDLPAHLQSRWIDTSSLPSSDLEAAQIQQAAAEEAEAFKVTFGCQAEVAVPPTFIWTPAVEDGWLRGGITTVITPGRRHGARDLPGKPVCSESGFYNGQISAKGAMYLVRDDYFEPARGHTAERALAALAAKTSLGRPTLLETHRANFLEQAGKAERALSEIERLLDAALRRWPRLRFMSSAELARHYRERSPLVDQRTMARLHCFLLRLAEVSPLRKLAWASGIAVPAALLCMAIGGVRRPAAKG